MRYVAALVVGLVAAATIVVIGLQVRANSHRPPSRTVITTPIVSSPLTPLQARRAKRTAAAKSPDSATPHQSGPSTPSAPLAAPKSAARPKASTGVPAPKKHKTTSKKPTATQPAPSPPPAQTQPSPPPAVTVPLPSVCLPPIKVGTCP